MLVCLLRLSIVHDASQASVIVLIGTGTIVQRRVKHDEQYWGFEYEQALVD